MLHTGRSRNFQSRHTDIIICNSNLRARVKCVVCLSSKSSVNDYIPDTASTIVAKLHLESRGCTLSDGHYVSIGGLLYQFTGSYYEELNESKEKH